MTNEEIDALIDTEIMGLKICKCKTPQVAFGHWGYCFRCNTNMAKNRTTCIKASIEALEKMRSEGYNAIFYIRKDGKNCCRLTKEDSTNGKETWSSRPLEMTIVLACLKAKGVNVESRQD